MGWLNRLLGGNENLIACDLSKIGVDMHSHLIPGIDDGARSMDESIAMVNKFHELGYRKIITTPHVMSEVYPNTNDIINRGLDNLRKELTACNIPIEVHAAAEYYFDDAFMMAVKNRELLTIGDNYVLVEFSFHSEPTSEDVLFFEMQMAGYKPILAHFERYPYYFNSSEKAESLREKGVSIQINLNSLSGHYGSFVQKQAEKLIDQNLVHFVATDCHRIQHLNLLESNLKSKYMSKINDLNLRNSFL